MSLISTANAQAFCDHLAAVWANLLSACGSSAAAGAWPAARGTLTDLLTLTVGLADYQQEFDLIDACNTALAKGAAEVSSGYLLNVIQAMNNHVALRGPAVNSSVVDLPSFLTYYNGGGGGSKFSALVTPEFAALYKNLTKTALPAAGVMSPALQADWNATLTNSMATKIPGGAYTQGASVDTTQYSEVVPVVEVRTVVSGGSGAMTVTIAGTDDQGNAATWGPVTLTGNNPAAALSGLTVTNSIAAGSRASRLVSSSTGIVAGSVITVNKNKPDQELCVVESVADGTHITIACTLAHGAGATIDGWNSYAAGNASTGAGRRLRAVTGINFSLNGQNAGLITVAGAQDRRSL